MIDFNKDELRNIFNKVKDNITHELNFEEYFKYIKNPELFNLQAAVNFDYISRNINLYDDMLGKYTAPERIGLFANTHLIEEACVKNKIEFFDLFKYPIQLTYGDNTHGNLSASRGNYASDLYYKSSGNSGIEIKVEVKSVNSISELANYTGKATSTGFPYNADYLILFNRINQEFVLVARDINYYSFKTKQTGRISGLYERVKIDHPRRDQDRNIVYDENHNEIIDTEYFVISKLPFKPEQQVLDVSATKFNVELVELASKILDAVGIEQLHSKRKNY